MTVAGWISATNGTHLKDDAREIARLGDGGWVSIQASRYHLCEPRIDSAKRYSSVEIGSKGVLEGPGEAATLLAPYRRERGSAVVFARVPVQVAESYISARGGIVAEAAA